jgi:tRNA(adenine34) deaminase
MCAGALLHGRVGRVVFAAADPKTGAAGSVLNLFAYPTLNHQTQVEQGVLADACSQEIKHFFQARRTKPSPLRDDALRTPDSAFAGLNDCPAVDFFTPAAGAFAGLRMAYTAIGSTDQPIAWLLLHGAQDWRYVWRHLLPALAGLGHDVVAPDLIGCGQSDKPKKASAHGLQAHTDVLLEWIDTYSATRWVIVYDNSMAPLAEQLIKQDNRFVQAIEVERHKDTKADAERSTPFPDRGHQVAPAALQAWPAATAPAHAIARIAVDTPYAAQQAAQYLQSLMAQPK